MNSFRFLAVGTISARIQEILNEMGGPDRGKQSRLADIAGCSRGLINQLLKNPGQQLGYEYAKNIEDKLGWRVEWLLEGQLPKRVENQRAEHHKPPATDGDEIIELILLYRQSTKEARERILKYARAADKAPGALRIIFPIDDA
jgi:hypothetical protein